MGGSYKILGRLAYLSTSSPPQSGEENSTDQLINISHHYETIVIPSDSEERKHSYGTNAEEGGLLYFTRRTKFKARFCHAGPEPVSFSEGLQTYCEEQHYGPNAEEGGIFVSFPLATR